MVLTLTVTSTKKGGNPGGMCMVRNSEEFPAYFKYVYSARNMGSTSFTPNHQPIYESLTFSLARRLGLKTPDTFVLVNTQRNVTFQDWKRFDSKHDPSGRDYYFISKLLPKPSTELPLHVAESIVTRDNTYLQAVMISDVVGKRPNYMAYGGLGDGEIIYLDLGCSFVHATEGFLSLPHNIGVPSGKGLRSMIKSLSKYSLLNCSPDRDPINLAHFVEDVEKTVLPTLNPGGGTAVRSILSAEEIREIQGYLSVNLTSKLKSFKDQNLLVHNI